MGVRETVFKLVDSEGVLLPGWQSLVFAWVGLSLALGLAGVGLAIFAAATEGHRRRRHFERCRRVFGQAGNGSPVGQSSTEGEGK